VSVSIALVACLATQPADEIVYAVSGPQLVRELRCSRCHADSPRTAALWSRAPAPDLSQVGARLHPAALRALLADPRSVRPDASMPDLVPAERIADLVQFLAARADFDRDEPVVTVPELERGRELFHSVGCVACHDAWVYPWELEEPFEFVVASNGAGEAAGEEPVFEPDLGRLHERTSLAALTELLLDPVAVWPEGRMPSLDLTPSEARSIAIYLLQDQARGADGTFPLRAGLVREYFHEDARFDLDELEGLRWKRIELVAQPELPEDCEDDYFGVRITGMLEIEVAPDRSQVWMTGPAVEVFSGELPNPRRLGR